MPCGRQNNRIKNVRINSEVGLNRAAGAKKYGFGAIYKCKITKFFACGARKNEDFRAIYKGKMGVKSAAGENFFGPFCAIFKGKMKVKSAAGEKN